MNKNKKLWIGVISLVLAFLMFAVLLMIQKNMNKEPVYVDVICVKNTAPKNMVITERNVGQYFTVEKIPSDFLPADYVSNKEALHGMVLETGLSAGTVLTDAMIKEYKEYYQEYQNLTWISVPVKELYGGVAGSIRTGDYIDIYILCKEEDYQCSLLAEHVRVEGVYSERGTEIKEGDEDGLSQLIVIPMEREQVSVFYELLARGDIRLAKYESI